MQYAAGGMTQVRSSYCSSREVSSTPSTHIAVYKPSITPVAGEPMSSKGTRHAHGTKTDVQETHPR